MVNYLGYCLHANLSGESKPMKSLKQVNTKLQLLYRQNEFPNLELCKLLCNSLIQSHFDYAFISWYPLISLKMRINITILLDSKH